MHVIADGTHLRPLSMPILQAFDAQATATLLDFSALVDALAQAAQERDAGSIRSPVRTSLPLAEQGALLSMPATAADIAIHKLVSVCPGNAARNLPTIFGTVTICDGTTGQPEFVLDGPTVTGRRTAALSMLGVRLLHRHAPRAFLIVGTGQQARFHAAAIAQLHPGAAIRVQGTRPETELRFCAALADEGIAASPARDGTAVDADVVITATTSKTPVYSEAANAGRLVVAVGAFTPDAAEIASDTVRASTVFVDDIDGAHDEAGDLIQAGVDWTRVQPLSAAITAQPAEATAVLLKTVGCAAWDLAACRVARAALDRR